MSSQLAVLQTVRLKGMATPDAVAAATGLSEADASAALASLVEEGSCEERRERFRATREGRDKLTAMLEEERAGVEAAAMNALYEEFQPLNTEFKEIVNAWQVREGDPNEHDDPDYDAEVLARLDQMHERFAGLLGRIVEAAPRLEPYPARFDHALQQLRGGDHSWFLKPLADSYHTVWFELHEDLIGLAGLTRADEATEGRA